MVLDKDVQESENETPVEVKIDVYSDTHNAFPVDLGWCKKEQIARIHALVGAAFETLASTRVLTFVDRDGTTLHFNTDHVTCIKVRTR